MSVILPITADPRFRLSTAAGGETSYSVPFPFQDNDDIALVRIAADGTETPQVEGTHYLLTGAGDPEGGTAALTTPMVAGEKMLRAGRTVLDRVTSIMRGGKYSSAAIDEDLDRWILIAQELSRDIGQAVRVPLGSSVHVLPTPVASKFWKWNADATRVEFVDVLSAGELAVSSYWQDLLGAANVGEAQEALGIDDIITDVAAVKARLPIDFETVAALLADTTMSYTIGALVVAAGDVVTAAGFRYSVAASGAAVITKAAATGYHLITAGGIKLYVDRIRDAGFNVRAFGAKGDYDDDTTAVQRAIWALKPGGGGTLYVPNGGYYIKSSLEPANDCAGIRIIGEGYRGTLIAWASATAGDLFSWSSDLDHVICENFAAGNLGNCNRLMIIACIRSTFRNIWYRPTEAVNTALVAATTGVTTYDLSFDDCHFESVSQAELNGTGLDIPRGHTLNVRNCFFSGIRFSLKLGSASESIDGVNVTGCRFELFSGTASDRPGATDCLAIDVINVRGFNLSGSNFELAADTHATSTGHRAVVLRQKAIGGMMSGCFVIGHGEAQGAVEINHADARMAMIGNSFSAIDGYAISVSAGSATQIYAPAGANLAVGGTTGISA